MTTRDERELLVRLGRRVALLRVARGLSQAGAARRAGIPLRALGAIERGERPVDVLRLARLSVVLRVPLADLVPGLPWDELGQPS